jgi:hypothetical protein
LMGTLMNPSYFDTKKWYNNPIIIQRDATKYLFFHWHYSPLWALACRTRSFYFFLSVTNSLHHR